MALSPGVSSTQEVIVQFKKQGKPVVGDVRLFVLGRLAKPVVRSLPLLARTGKARSRRLLVLCEKAGLKAVVAGNIGLPVLDVLGRNINMICLMCGCWSYRFSETRIPLNRSMLLLHVY